MRLAIGCIFSFLACAVLQAQTFDYKSFVKELSSSTYMGRGYINDGAIRAAERIQSEFQTLGVQPLYDSYFQEFRHTVNTFPKTPEFFCDSNWVAGRDFIVHPMSGSGSADWKKVIVLDSSTYANRVKSGNLFAYLNSYGFEGKGVVLPESKLTWSVADQQLSIPIIQALHPSSTCKAELKVKAKLKKIRSYNVIGRIKGTKDNDSTLYITAHYDHLGAMGDVFIPGANDNAAGVAMLMSLAEKIAKNPLPYDVIFIAFAGEEAGLLGSRYFVNNPLTDLSKIKMLINLDLVGTGSEGATVVNATEFPEDFKRLTNINNSNTYLTKINARGAAANSDHYWFYKQGVPSFFIYTQGGPKAYHDINDVAENLPYTSFEALQELVLEFFKSF